MTQAPAQTVRAPFEGVAVTGARIKITKTGDGLGAEQAALDKEARD